MSRNTFGVTANQDLFAAVGDFSRFERSGRLVSCLGLTLGLHPYLRRSDRRLSPFFVELIKADLGVGFLDCGVDR